MNKFVQAIDDLPYIIKIIFCIPALDIIWWVYRIFKSVLKDNLSGLILAIILLIIGIPWIWLVDMVTMLLKGKVYWVD